jgi:mono/diheme cytochrome c family protein
VSEAGSALRSRRGTTAVLACLLGLAAPVTHAADAPAARFADGAASFQANCAVCHGAAGTGLPSLAPPLTSYPARYAASPEGRRQLAMTVLYGLFGEITVDDKRFDFRMPDFSRLDDATLAATLNFIVFDLGHAGVSVKPLDAADIAAERAQPRDGAAVREHRKTLAPVAP